MRRAWIITLATVLLCTGCATTIDPAGVVAIRSRTNYGSGVVVGYSERSYLIATAAHVVLTDNIPLVDAELGKLVAIDILHDLALLQVPDKGQGYPIRELADPIQGEPTIALGWTFYRNDCERLAYRGYVVTTHWPHVQGSAIISGGIFPGMSGGPVVDARNRVVGIIRGVHQMQNSILLDSTAIITPARYIRAIME